MDISSLLDNIRLAQDLETLEEAFEQALGKKGWLSGEYIILKDLSPEEKKTRGATLAQAKAELHAIYIERMDILKTVYINKQLEQDIVDISTPHIKHHPGSYSLLTYTRRKIEEICQNMGFHIEYGHDMVTKFENFISLNIPLTHPATEMHDTFFLEDRDDTGENYVLRTHTTALDNSMIKEF